MILENFIQKVVQYENCVMNIDFVIFAFKLVLILVGMLGLFTQSFSVPLFERSNLTFISACPIFSVKFLYPTFPKDHHSIFLVQL